jgi:hypothetical protein
MMATSSFLVSAPKDRGKSGAYRFVVYSFINVKSWVGAAPVLDHCPARDAPRQLVRPTRVAASGVPWGCCPSTL